MQVTDPPVTAKDSASFSQAKLLKTESLAWLHKWVLFKRKKKVFLKPQTKEIPFTLERDLDPGAGPGFIPEAMTVPAH